MADESIQQQRLQHYVDAEQKALESQEWQKKDFKNRRANLTDISAGINQLLAGTGSGRRGRAKRIVLRDE